MDSQLTFINPPELSTLIFNNDSTKNATIYLRSSRSSITPLYTVLTPDKNGYRTEVHDVLTGKIVACIERRDVLADLVMFPQRSGKDANMKINTWLKKTTLPDGYPVRRLITPYGEFICRSDPAHRIALYSPTDLTTSIAQYHLAMPGASPSSPQNTPAITLDAQAAALREDIIAAFLYLEQEMRMTESRLRRAMGQGQMEASAAGFTGAF